MNLETINLFVLYDKNIEQLNISNKKIEGILCLEKFINLKYLNCSNNQITKLLYLSEDLININWKSNPLIELEIRL